MPGQAELNSGNTKLLNGATGSDFQYNYFKDSFLKIKSADENQYE